MTKILFLCLGNICRSPMAEFVMKDLVKKAGLADRFQIDSVAVSANEVGNPIYGPAARELRKHGIAFDDHRSRQITQADYDDCDRVYYMDASNLRRVKPLLRETSKLIPLLPRDVADPWYTGDFETAWDDILEGCQKILEEFQ